MTIDLCLQAGWNQPSPLPMAGRVVGPDVGGDFYDETQQGAVFFVGEEEYQQELAKRWIWHCLARKKV